ncbi:MAG: GIY-YIG nuclease family protein [Parvibaculum sp.]|uniref:GIY-YIG nuclease family protein n=1 Tax=Parvibaculum sp. TaxID=2024848 RepID=UPI003C71FD34
MDKDRKRQIARNYKERKASPGVYAIRCTATGDIWIAPSRNLDSQQNGIWFTLRLGTHPNKALQAVWNAHGEASFAYEVVEQIENEDLTPYLLDALLKERIAHWRTELGAGLAVG